jgi:hypothetical protein
MDNKTLEIYQVYTQEMSQYFNPFQVVASVLQKVEFNPYTVQNLNIDFILGDSDVYYNKVRVRITFCYMVPDDWIEYFKDKLQFLLKEAFATSYGKKADKKWNDYFGIKDIYPFFTKEFGDEVTQDK